MDPVLESWLWEVEIPHKWYRGSKSNQATEQEQALWG